jgi:hypothetical protein
MVAKVITGKNITELIGYNESKVTRGVAECLLASGFLKDETKLTRREKVARFTNLTEKNRRSKTNVLHVPVSFSPEEKLSRETLAAIAVGYMNKIGFGEQPYLVYLHRDTAILHMHIVSTLIQENGRRIPVHNIGRNESARARRELEKEYGLVKAEARGKLKRLLKEPRRDSLKKVIDRVLMLRSVTTMERFVQALSEKQVNVQIHTNTEGRTFGITFYDLKSKQSFKGSELGKGYSVNAIIRRLDTQHQHPSNISKSSGGIVFHDAGKINMNTGSASTSQAQLLDNLVGNGNTGQSPEATLRLTRRKKKRRKKRKL